MVRNEPKVWWNAYENGVPIYAAIIAWALYFTVIPYLWTESKWAACVVIATVGVFINTLLIYFQHECWHNYFKVSSNRKLFILLCTILFVQPHIYDIGHRSHHAKVNTFDDLELYPHGEIQRRELRILCNCMSILFGSLFLVMLGGRHQTRCSWPEALMRFMLTYTGSAVLWGAVAYISYKLFNVEVLDIAVSYAITIWAVSVCHHHNELIEHGNLIVEGDFRFRSGFTRNLSSDGWFAKLFLVLVHQDSREHTLHHTNPSVLSRPFVGRYDMPRSATCITFREYLRIVLSMIRGEREVITQTKVRSTHGINAA